MMTPEQKQAKIKEAMSNRLICSKQEMEDAIEFVLDLLEIEIEETEENEPYATNSIRQMQVATTRITTLMMDMMDIEI